MPSARDPLPAQPNQSLINGLSCLQALAVAQEPVGSRELARLLDLEPTKVNRLLKTLAHLGLAEQGERRKYRPGPAIHLLAAQVLFGSGLLRRAVGPLESLRDHGRIVAMGVLWRDQTCYLYHAGPEVPVAQGLGHYRLFPATSSGIGMALLAHRPEREILDLYAPGRDARSGSRPATDPISLDGDDGLLARLARIRETGYALVQVPDTENRTLAMPVGTPPYAAVGLSGRFDDGEGAVLVPALRHVIDQIDTREEAL